MRRSACLPIRSVACWAASFPGASMSVRLACDSAAWAGARHILLSIVNTDRPEVRVLAETALGKRGGDLVEVSGPEEMTLWELVRRTPGPGGILPTPVFLPTGFGRAFRRGALLPGPGVEEAGPGLEDWANRADPS